MSRMMPWYSADGICAVFQTLPHRSHVHELPYGTRRRLPQSHLTVIGGPFIGRDRTPDGPGSGRTPAPLAACALRTSTRRVPGGGLASCFPQVAVLYRPGRW